MEDLIEILEAVIANTRREYKAMLEFDRRKGGNTYFLGKIAGLEFALEKARSLNESQDFKNKMGWMK